MHCTVAPARCPADEALWLWLTQDWQLISEGAWPRRFCGEHNFAENNYLNIICKFLKKKKKVLNFFLKKKKFYKLVLLTRLRYFFILLKLPYVFFHQFPQYAVTFPLTSVKFSIFWYPTDYCPFGSMKKRYYTWNWDILHSPHCCEHSLVVNSVSLKKRPN